MVQIEQEWPMHNSRILMMLKTNASAVTRQVSAGEEEELGEEGGRKQWNDWTLTDLEWNFQ